MRDDRDDRLDRLLALVRQAKSEPSPLEEGFETRIMARIREDRERKTTLASWAWRLAPVFITIVVFLGALEYVALPPPSADLYSVVAEGGEEEHFLRLWTGE